MKIAQIAPLYEAVPPSLYGGTERVVAHLTDALVELGHEVTLFASADSRTSAQLVPGCERALRLDPAPLKSDIASHLSMLHTLRERADEFDALHFHVDLLHFPLFEPLAERTLTTLHGRLDLKGLPEAYRRWHRFPLVSISHHQRTPLAFANWHGTVHHGLNASTYRFHEQMGEGYLAFLGRISPEKRPDRAIAIARQAGVPIKLAAKVDNADRKYFEQEIKPLLDDPLVEFIGEIGDSEKSEFLGNARALLFPIDWPEPFGLVMIEAMACGTPVIAWHCGSVPEVVEPGVTGYIVTSEEQAVEAARQVLTLDRRRVREVFEQRFSATAMARHYLELYRQLPGNRNTEVNFKQTA
ncbi:glycosyltransferase family 4 protein [Pseudomonas sp. MAG002Y]|uniref:glycosyltransferase family 4 protein n=1 Tax=unclassified Pseudomonas TaxID=196821 RepID=UPI001C608758|nr:glycosyltransferase family 4 protein [Pseudomonas sp. MAG002Y]MBW5414697.1 glycosyltransferase [Pseudomonas sp. MAG002Y]